MNKKTLKDVKLLDKNNYRKLSVTFHSFRMKTKKQNSSNYIT